MALGRLHRKFVRVEPYISFAISLGFFAWLAQGMTLLDGLGWPELIFLATMASAVFLLIISAALALWKYFRPAQAPANALPIEYKFKPIIETVVAEKLAEFRADKVVFNVANEVVLSSGLFGRLDWVERTLEQVPAKITEKTRLALPALHHAMSEYLSRRNEDMTLGMSSYGKAVEAALQFIKNPDVDGQFKHSEWGNLTMRCRMAREGVGNILSELGVSFPDNVKSDSQLGLNDYSEIVDDHLRAEFKRVKAVHLNDSEHVSSLQPRLAGIAASFANSARDKLAQAIWEEARSNLPMGVIERQWLEDIVSKRQQ